MIRLLRARGGSVLPLIALMMVVLLVSAGSGIDLARQAMLRRSLQDIADNAALAGITQGDQASALAAARLYVTNATKTLAGPPTVAATYEYDAAAASAPTLSVALSADMPTTLMAPFRATLPVGLTAVATGSLMRKVTVNVTNFNASASDLNRIYYYAYPQSYSGATLYNYMPTLTPNTLILSNGANDATVSNTFAIPLDATVGFAMTNTTGGIAPYGNNCWGQAQGTTATYYSTKGQADGTYRDTNAIAFRACVRTRNANGVLTSNCPGLYILVCPSGTNYAAGSYIYASGYGRNPLQYTTSNTDCSKGDVGFSWDDNGGTGDDNDFNDARFTANCTDTTIGGTTVRLVS